MRRPMHARQRISLHTGMWCPRSVQHRSDWNIRRKHESVVQVRTLVAKLIGVVFSIAAGLIAGKEGPFVHGGGIVGGGIGSMGSQ